MNATDLGQVSATSPDPCPRSPGPSEDLSLPRQTKEPHTPGRARKVGSPTSPKGSGGGVPLSGVMTVEVSQEEPVGELRNMIKALSSRNSTPRTWKRIEPNHTGRAVGMESPPVPTDTPPQCDSPGQLSPSGRRGSVRNIFPNFMRASSQSVVVFPSILDKWEKSEKLENKGEYEDGAEISEKTETEHFRSNNRGLSEPNLPSCPMEEREKAENFEEIFVREKDTQQEPAPEKESPVEKENSLEFPRKRIKKRGELMRNLSAPRLSKFTGNPAAHHSAPNLNEFGSLFLEGCGDVQSQIFEDLITKKMMKPNGVVIKDRKWHTKTFKACFVGKEMVDWLISNNYVATREDGVNFGKKLISFGLLEQLTSEGPFKDEFQYYRFKKPIPASPKKKLTKRQPKLTKGKSMETIKSMIAFSPPTSPTGGGVVGGTIPAYSPKRHTNFGNLDSPGIILSNSGNIQQSGTIISASGTDLLPKKGGPEIIIPYRAIITEQKTGNSVSQTGTETLPKKAGSELITPYRAMITEQKTVNGVSEKIWSRPPKNTGSFSEKKTDTKKDLKKASSTPEKPVTQSKRKKSVDSMKNSLINKNQKKKLQKKLKKQAKEREKKTKEKELKLVHHLNSLLEKGHRHMKSPPAPELHFMPAPPILPVL